MLKNISLIIVATLSSVFLSSCASVVSGTNQSVSVKTGSVKGATCSLENNKGKWYVNSTPGSVTINRSYHDLTVSCEKKGYPTKSKAVASNTKAITFGNVFLGGAGIIGAGIDVANGSAYDYPTDIEVPLNSQTA